MVNSWLIVHEIKMKFKFAKQGIELFKSENNDVFSNLILIYEGNNLRSLINALRYNSYRFE